MKMQLIRSVFLVTFFLVFRIGIAANPIQIEAVGAPNSSHLSKFLEPRLANKIGIDDLSEEIRSLVRRLDGDQRKNKEEELSELGFHCDGGSCLYMGVYKSENRAEKSLTSTMTEIQITVKYDVSPSVVSLRFDSVHKDSSGLLGSQMGEFLHLHAPFENGKALNSYVKSYIRGLSKDLREVGFVCDKSCSFEGEQLVTTETKGGRKQQKYKYTIRVEEQVPESIKAWQTKIN